MPSIAGQSRGFAPAVVGGAGSVLIRVTTLTGAIAALAGCAGDGASDRRKV
jgi:hypothetical protein